MSEKNWESVGFPPLRLTLNQLQGLVTAAGPDAELTRDGSERIELEELIPSGQTRTTAALVKTPAMKLELTSDHATLSFDDQHAKTADELVVLLSKQSSSVISLLIPLLLGIAVFFPLALLDIRLDLVSFATLASMLLGMIGVALKRRGTRATSEPVDGEPHRWRTTFSCTDLRLHELGELVDMVGEDSQLEFVADSKEPSVVIRRQGLELTLRDGEGEIVYDDASSHYEDFYNLVQKHGKRLHMFTHDDLSIFVGMLFPIAAMVFAPDESQHGAVAISLVPWLGYASWVLGNQKRRWCTIVRSSTTAET